MASKVSLKLKERVCQLRYVTLIRLRHTSAEDVANEMTDQADRMRTIKISFPLREL